MRIGDALWFSPRFRFADMNFDDKTMLIQAFRDRVDGFFLQPAGRSIAAKDAFAGGLVCCAAIEFIATSRICNDSSSNILFQILLAETRDFVRRQLAVNVVLDGNRRGQRAGADATRGIQAE